MKNKESREFDKALKIVASSSVVVLASILISKLITYVYIITIARKFGAEVYGFYALSMMITGIFITLSYIGLNEGIIRYISIFRGKKKKKEINFIVKKTLIIVAFNSVLSAIIVALFSEELSILFGSPELSEFLFIFSLAIPLTVLPGVFLSALRGFEQIGWFAFIGNVFTNLIRLGFLLVFVFIGIGYQGVATSYIIGALGTLLLGYYILKRKTSVVFSGDNGLGKKKRDKIFKEVISYSWPLIFFSFAYIILGWIDSFVIGIYRDAESVGYYNAAISIAFILVIFKDLFRYMFFPLVTREHTKGNDRVVEELSKQLGKWVFVMTLPIFILFMFFPGALLSILFGAEFLNAINALRFLAVGAMVTSLFGFSKDLISMRGKSKTILVDVIIAGTVNLILNFILVPKYGIEGAGFSTMISLIILNLLFMYQSWKEVRVIPIRRKMIRIVIASIIPTLLLFLVRSYVDITSFSAVILGGLFMLSYFLLVLLTGCLDKNDLMILNSVKKKVFRSKHEK